MNFSKIIATFLMQHFFEFEQMDILWLGMLVPKALARERRLTYLNGLDDIRYIWKLNYEQIFEKIFATWGRSFSDFFH